MTEKLVRENERVDDLQNGYYVIQDPEKFCFGMDAVLLSGFTKVKKGENVPEIARELEEDEKSIRWRVEIVNQHAPAYDLEAILDEVMCAKKASE